MATMKPWFGGLHEMLAQRAEGPLVKGGGTGTAMGLETARYRTYQACILDAAQGVSERPIRVPYVEVCILCTLFS